MKQFIHTPLQSIHEETGLTKEGFAELMHISLN